MNIESYRLKFCEQGHVFTNFDQRYRNPRCVECGSGFVSECPECGAKIDDRWSSPATHDGKPLRKPGPPKCCGSCGNPFQWKSESGPPVTKSLSVVRNICHRFHRCVNQLSHRYNQRPTFDINDEYDVQDFFHVLLQPHFDDIRREETTPSHAEKSGRIDFLLMDGGIGIEIKKTREGLDGKRVGEQITEDINRYKKHPSCKCLIFFVYDPGHLVKNPTGLINDLAEDGIEIIINPKI